MPNDTPLFHLLVKPHTRLLFVLSMISCLHYRFDRQMSLMDLQLQKPLNSPTKEDFRCGNTKLPLLGE